jgi:arylsulfatase A-like enzyme
MGILWIVTTQWRAQACGYANDPNANTPNLDTLAKESVDFTQAVTPHPFGPFARAALITGIASPENKVVDYYDPLPSSSRTIAHDLNDQGYSTSYFGKWHLSRRDPDSDLVGENHAKTIIPPENRGGFSFFEGFESGFLLNDPWLHGTRLPQPTQFKGYQSDILCDRAASWIKSESKPWFCVVSLEAPHPPYSANASEIPAADPKSLILRANIPDDSSIREKARAELSGYYAHIEATDRAIGKLLKEIPEDTIVVFTSVHGDMHGSHGLFRKGWPHEESIRVPLLVRLPKSAVKSAGIKTHQLVSLLDIPQWTRAWAKTKLGSHVTHEYQVISMPSVVKLPYQCNKLWTGVRTLKRKLILNADKSVWFFFDLEKDPLEKNNLALDPAYENEIKTLKGILTN